MPFGKITKYGSPTPLNIIIAAIVLTGASFEIETIWVRILLIIIALGITGFMLHFFRDPERHPPDRSDVILSPADGKIINIKDVTGRSFINGEAKQLSIFMSPMDVHVNRIPISGTIKHLDYKKGRFHKAFTDKADKENERCVIGIESEYGNIMFTQVSGAMARRIVTDLEIGGKVKMGERFGMIKFGSRSDVIVPEGWEPVVKMGAKVKAGETILFERKEII